MQDSLLAQLPSELLLHLLSFLDLASLGSLARTSRAFHSLVQTSILPAYAVDRLGYAPSTLRRGHDTLRWTWGRKAAWTDRIVGRWEAEGRYSGVSFGEWDRTLPSVRLWDVERGVSGVLIARGTGLEWWVAQDLRGTMVCVPVVVQGFDDPLVRLVRDGKKRSSANALDDITALTAGRAPGHVVVSRVSGVVQKLEVVDVGGRGRAIVLAESARYAIPRPGPTRPGSTAVQALDSNRDLIAAASTIRLPPPHPRHLDLDEGDSLARSLAKRAAPKQHQVTLHSLSSPWSDPAVVPLKTKSWSVHLAPTSSPDWLAIGNTSTAPLSLVPLDSTGCPITSAMTSLAHTTKSTSVYGLTSPSLDCSPFLRPDQTVIAAFFDSSTRIYDLRIRPSPSSSSALVTPSDWDDPVPPANEVMRLADPWSDDPCYSVACGGPLGCSVAVGSARNSAVRLFDIRQPSASLPPTTTMTTMMGTKSSDRTRRPRRGWTAFSPSGDRSPVYGLAIETSRIWGVTERSAFVLNYHAGRDGPRGTRREDRVAYVKHDGEGKGELRRTMHHEVEILPT
ncbi:hypothetical protein JCM10212_000305 [Sporobolomyces blumeae]